MKCSVISAKQPRRRLKQHRMNVYPTGSLVRITSYGPFRGLRGKVHSVHTISPDFEEPFCFYLIDLDGVQLKDPIWFEYDEVELVASPLVTLQVRN
jgi:hypothetical protein